MANSDNGADQAEGNSAALIEADDGISDTNPAAELEVIVRPVATDVELREIKDDLKDFIEKSMTIKTSSLEAGQQKNDELRRLYSGTVERIREMEFKFAAL